jgi:methyl-accepting chemotaxis protein
MLVRNVSLTSKIGVLVAVLVISGGAIAIVGARQVADLDERFERVVDQSCRAIILAEAARVDLLQSIRAEKNAVLVVSKERAAAFAETAREERKELKINSQELGRLIGTGLTSREGKAYSDFIRAEEEFSRNQEEVLRLAVVKANWEGARLLHQEIGRRAQDVEDFIASLREAGGADPSATTRSAEFQRNGSKAAAGRELVGRLYGVLYNLSQHLRLTDEKDMTRLELELRSSISAFQESLWRLAASLSENERLRGGAVLSGLESLKGQAEQIQNYSRANTDLRAIQLTTSTTVELADRCDGAMIELITALSDRLQEEKRDADRQNHAGQRVVLATGAAGLLIGLMFSVVLIRSITRPVNDGVRVFEALAAGDLTRRMNLDRRDEIGRLGAASDHMAVALCDTVKQIRAVAAQLGGSANELSGVSHDLLAQSHEVATQAETVAAGTEQLSSNISSMAAAAEQMSVNVSSISSASEEVSVNVATISASAESASRSVGSVAEAIGRISGSLQDVARDARQGSTMTQEAREMAVAATRAMQQLDQAANEITKVTDVIKTIAIQTNLLALNATIEATSAGEAGRGFAVVAGEIKDLANQSGQSAEEIARKIEGVQACTCEAVTVIENVARSIGEINTSAGRISEAVGVQTQTATQIAGDVAQARKGVEDIARSIAEVAKGANDASGNTAEAAKAATDVSRNATEAASASQSISSNIHGVSEATRQSNASAVRVDEAARRLKEIAVKLQRSVEQFNTGVQVAAADHV